MHRIPDIEYQYSDFISTENTQQYFTLQELWKTFYTKAKTLQEIYKRYLSPCYLKGLQGLFLTKMKIPSLNQLLGAVETWGWKAVWVKRYVPTRIYAGLIASGYFPIAGIIRSKNFLKHSPVPDLLNNMWENFLLLCNHVYFTYIKELSKAIKNAENSELDNLLYENELHTSMLKHQGVPNTAKEIIAAKQALSTIQAKAKKTPSMQMQLARIFLWTVEFGIIKIPNKDISIIGDGILSSPQEWSNIVSKKIKLLPYSFNEALKKDFKYFSDSKPEFFVAPNIEYYNTELLSTKVSALFHD